MRLWSILYASDVTVKPKAELLKRDKGNECGLKFQSFCFKMVEVRNSFVRGLDPVIIDGASDSI